MAQVCCSAASATTVAAAILVGLAVAVNVHALAVPAVAGTLLGVVATGCALEARADLGVHGDTPDTTNCHLLTFRYRNILGRCSRYNHYIILYIVCQYAKQKHHAFIIVLMLGSGGWIALTLFASPLERDTCKHEFPFSLRRTSDYTRLRRDVAGPRLTASSHEKTPATRCLFMAQHDRGCYNRY